jgi:hypothetical protein
LQNKSRVNKCLGVATALLVALLLELTPGTALATTDYWHIGARSDVSSVKNFYSNVNTPTGPTSQGVMGFTIYWIGGTAVSGRYLTQPELWATQANPTTWTGRFEVYDSQLQQDIELHYTSFTFGAGGSAYLQTTILSGGQNYQQITDRNNSNHQMYFTFNSVNYGTTLNTVYTTLESQDFTGSHFNGMGTISFTNYQYVTNGGSVVTPQLFTYRYTSGFTAPPTCIVSSTPAAGTTNISNSC